MDTSNTPVTLTVTERACRLGSLSGDQYPALLGERCKFAADP